MYLSYYQLETKPFQISTDPKFLWLGEKHKEAMAVLRYGVMDNKGFLLLTGEVGTGKTTLINALVNTLGDEVLIATILDPGLEKDDFYHYLISAFELPFKFTTKSEFIRQFGSFLIQAHDSRKKVLLIIDEAQRLNQELLEESRLLSNIEKQTAKLINIFFVGQREFNSIILQPKNRALRQRITVNFDLQPLSLKETDGYIAHRLKVAGVEKKIFSAAAVREVYKYAKGYPRLINVICDRALLTGFTRDAVKISPKIIKECAHELTLKVKKRPAGQAAVPEKVKSKRKQPNLPVKTKGRTTEKILFIALASLIAAWIAAAIYFYFPQNGIRHFFGQSNTLSVEKPEPVKQKAAAESSGRKADVASSGADQLMKKAAPQPSAGESFDSGKILQDLFANQRTPLHVDLTEQNELTATARRKLNRLARVLSEKTSLEILIKGYAGDGVGNSRYNKKLSEFTANIVKGYLVGKGVAPQRIETTGIWFVNPETEKPDQDKQVNIRWVDIQLKNG
ncbi:MAG: AAA family ATPase [Deltaproteobacteria bacterium]